MLLRQDFRPQPSMPPRLFMEQILNSLGKAYCFLWDHKDGENKLQLSWDDVRRFFSKNTFRCSVRQLNNAGLLSYQENLQGISIELVGWDEVDTMT